MWAICRAYDREVSVKVGMHALLNIQEKVKLDFLDALQVILQIGYSTKNDRLVSCAHQMAFLPSANNLNSNPPSIAADRTQST
jgi:hypothetical protein